MPIPGSQEMESIGFAYFLFRWKWVIRILCLFLMLLGIQQSWKFSKILVFCMLILSGVIFYFTNMKMKAEKMFVEPEHVVMKDTSANEVPLDKLVLGVEYQGKAMAFPINYIAYHHKVLTDIGDKSIMVTYCNVCRTGRVFEPKVNGQEEKFRLVGMDHYNAMFEDHSTKSWWRQVNGEAVAGKLKGQFLPEFPSVQARLDQWIRLYPNTLIMQPDASFKTEYDSLVDFESGRPTGRLTRRDTIAWSEKAWVAGIEVKDASKAYDWNALVSKQIINDVVSTTPIVLFVASDATSLFAYQRLFPEQIFTLKSDTLTDGVTTYNLLGKPYDPLAKSLTPVKVVQEYWHSWRIFHPQTLKF